MAKWIHKKIEGLDIESITCSNCGCGAPLYSYIKEGQDKEKIQHMETDYCPNCGEKMEYKDLDYKKMWENLKLTLGSRVVHDPFTDGYIHEISCTEDEILLELMNSYEMREEYKIKKEN